MAGKIKLVLAQPDKIVKTGDFSGVVLPAFAGYLTVISGRAPSMVWLQPGVVQILNPDGKVSEKFFISNGVADIVNDTCTISAEVVIAKKDISLSEAKEKLETAPDEATAVFYQIVYDELEGFPEK